MGVYIKGMKKPIMCITEDGFMGGCPMDRIWCMQRFAPRDKNVGECYKEMTGTTPCWCPLVNIDEPHGRLIDADTLIKASGVTILVTGENNARVVAEALESVYQDIEDAPTVIEAEEAKK